MKIQYILKYTLISGFIALLLYGCVYSVHPLFRESDLIFREELTGKWESNDEVTWHFEQGKDSYYDVIHVSDNDTTLLTAGLGKLGEHYYLDFTLEEVEDLTEMEIAHLFPTHTFARVSFGEDEITLESFGFSAQWLENLIKEKRIRIKHESTEDHVLLTASTSELQKFVIKYSNEPKAFGDSELLSKVTPE